MGDLKLKKVDYSQTFTANRNAVDVGAEPTTTPRIESPGRTATLGIESAGRTTTLGIESPGRTSILDVEIANLYYLGVGIVGRRTTAVEIEPACAGLNSLYAGIFVVSGLDTI